MQKGQFLLILFAGNVKFREPKQLYPLGGAKITKTFYDNFGAKRGAKKVMGIIQPVEV